MSILKYPLKIALETMILPILTKNVDSKMWQSFSGIMYHGYSTDI